MGVTMKIVSVDIPPDLGYTGYMKLRYGTLTANYAFGIYVHNWGYPIRNEWEIGIYLFKWYVGLDFFK
jgi:hypothetical protein